MDKITRMLMLYTRLSKGEHINKEIYCFEMEISYRSFDRDIEDMRLYFSETGNYDDVIYDRAEKTYYLSGITSQPLEEAEYAIIEEILIDSYVLRRDELATILRRLGRCTKFSAGNRDVGHILKDYDEDNTNKPMIKLCYDLQNVIERKSVIEIHYQIGREFVCEKVIPYRISIQNQHLMLDVIYADDLNHAVSYELNDIESFTVLRPMRMDEREYIETKKSG